MRDAALATAHFDAFYKDARSRLLLQTYALTGDLPASRAAVRDAFIVAWHHWRKVSRREDPEAWVRPQAWAHAQRRHTARVWHRDKSLDPAVTSTLDALGKLTLLQRKVLLLTLLTTGSMAEIAREVGLPREEAERQLQTATARYAVLRDIASTDVRTTLEPLRAQVEEARWPRSTIVRRAGGARRRTHTAMGVLGSVAALVVSGALVTQGGDLRPTLADPTPQRVLATPSPVSGEPVELSADGLLSTEQVTRLAPRRSWSEKATTDRGGAGLPCRIARAADPEGEQVLVRRWVAADRKDAPELTVVQLSELAASEPSARRAFRTTLEWYAGCTDRRVQLLATAQVERVGDQADVFVLRSWRRPVSTLVVGLARTGRVITTTMTRSAGTGTVDREALAALLATATNALCGTPGSGTCAGPPKLTLIDPIPVGEVPAMLNEVDLPPVTGVEKPWVGTQIRRATVNYAASGCARARFNGNGVSNALTRSFVIPNAKLPAAFGITQTVGSLPSRRARDWVAEVRRDIANCAEKRLGTSVERVLHREGKHEDVTVWNITTEISDSRAVSYQMAVLRNRTGISQLGFIPAEKVRMRPGAFGALAERTLDRLRKMPKPGRG